VAISQDGKVSIAQIQGNLIKAIDDVGEILWTKSLNQPIFDIIVGSEGSYIAFDDETPKILYLNPKGELEWEKEFDSGIVSQNLIRKESNLFVATSDKVIMTIDKHGEILTSQEVDFNVNKITISKDGDSFIVLTEESDIFFIENLEEECEVFYEILCRGTEKCGTFVSAVYTGSCPRCGSDRNVVRIIKEKL
jgi:outer membrane protein assembly factor BamB